jgi:hypothetical protein
VAKSYNMKDLPPEAPSITVPIVAYTKYAPTTIGEQGWSRQNRRQSGPDAWFAPRTTRHCPGS